MKHAATLFAGALFGMGLVLSGMTDTAKVIGFLDITGAWDPSLAWVMGAALSVTLVATPVVLRRPAPWFWPRFELPQRTDIDGRLIVGSALLGLGWGLWGYCPGPALTALVYGDTTTVIFVLAMVGGMFLSTAVADGKPNPPPPLEHS